MQLNWSFVNRILERIQQLCLPNHILPRKHKIICQLTSVEREKFLRVGLKISLQGSRAFVPEAMLLTHSGWIAFSGVTCDETAICYRTKSFYVYIPGEKVGERETPGGRVDDIWYAG